MEKKIHNISHDRYLSIYIPDLYTQDKAFRIQGNFNLPSPSAPCLFIGNNTEERLPRPLTWSHFVIFYDRQVIQY